jgi:hypothetical protein
MEASGAGAGGFAPPVHGMKVPPWLTYPRRPLESWIPITYR